MFHVKHFTDVYKRQVANLSSLEEYCVPFVKIGGNFITYKSGEIEEEVSKKSFWSFLKRKKRKSVYSEQKEKRERLQPAEKDRENVFIRAALEIWFSEIPIFSRFFFAFS